MDKMDLYTRIIPAILIFCLVYYNVRKMQKRAKAMRQEHSCNGSCAGCAHSASCSSAEKAAHAQDETQEPKEDSRP